MYLVIRCPGCKTFNYVDRYQRWRLCPMCGEVINVQRAPVYLDTDDFQDAERVVEQLESYLHQTGKKDLTEQDIRQLRAQYARWVKNRV
ncbi:hypothetical protein L21_2594 [Methanoculleus chikugoensis]|jgi:acetyl-CoA carboxylase beta subunit|uniref:DUF1922 domain-containing protein n=1 Tax=Methanoculleus chikugoensis TaxID=118126 RepID=A0A1M4MP59_9EURY|nr:DUF1922 domain-containing protein [Methanoculleus chikugoensis]MDD4567884.1 DUF1922 domain-containing protein [Methanoculleus chikugoensis]NMA10690.1 DUF1922 domain-containing protein [Methanomicrobiales archaeon]SCL76656.1 hypothetical protein L21_2594 [Methanoculleus chikugoensis]